MFLIALYRLQHDEDADLEKRTQKLILQLMVDPANIVIENVIRFSSTTFQAKQPSKNNVTILIILKLC